MNAKFIFPAKLAFVEKLIIYEFHSVISQLKLDPSEFTRNSSAKFTHFSSRILISDISNSSKVGTSPALVVIASLISSSSSILL
jgi:hypothetical protein